MISLNGPQLRTLEAEELIKHTARIYGEQKQYKKAPIINRKEKGTNWFKIHASDTMCWV